MHRDPGHSSMISEAKNYPMGSIAQPILETAERPRVLVAEDQEDVIAALRLLLKNNGYDVDFVQSPADALTRLRTGNFDACLLDLNYSRDTTSGTEGLELLSRVQELDSTLAVVVMTAWGSIELAVDAMHRGACDFVQKPWDNAELLKVLDQQMQRSRMLRSKRDQEQLEQQEAAQMQRALMPGQIAAPKGLVIAALSLSNLQAAVRMLAAHVAHPQELCNRVNEIVAANNVPGKFITFFYAVIDAKQKHMTYTNAGHNWPILARANGSCERLSSEDVVLGTVRNWTYHEKDIDLLPGDRLVLFTDGITEAANTSGVELGEDYLVNLVCEKVDLTAFELKDQILQSTL